jgi:hypothetical protein
MTETMPQYAIDELTAYINMPDVKLLLSYKLYLMGDHHQYSHMVIDEIKKEIDKRGLTL